VECGKADQKTEREQQKTENGRSKQRQLGIYTGFSIWGVCVREHCVDST